MDWRAPLTLRDEVPNLAREENFAPQILAGLHNTLWMCLFSGLTSRRRMRELLNLLFMPA